MQCSYLELSFSLCSFGFTLVTQFKLYQNRLKFRTMKEGHNFFLKQKLKEIHYFVRFQFLQLLHS